MVEISPLLLIHVGGAVVGLLSGYLSIFLRKGSDIHRLAGNVFVLSMMAMSSTAVYLAVFVNPVAINAVVGTLTFYLVTTAWLAGRRREPKFNVYEKGAMAVVAVDGAFALAYGLQQTAPQHGVPTQIYFVFGTIALLLAFSDLRAWRRGGVEGTKRIARHLWRMCLALMIATLSFYPGQARLLPPEIRKSGLLWTPMLVLVVLTIYWLIRVSRKRKGVAHATPSYATANAVALPPRS